MRGVLVTLEGIDGSGKTTALRRISQRLIEAFPERQFVFTAEPTSSPVGEILRKVHLAGRHVPEVREICDVRMMEEMLLFMADHANHLAKTVIPALKEGNVVVSDRYADSTAAYQGVTLRGIVPDPVGWIRDLFSPWNVVPGLTLLFRIDTKTAIRRIRSRRAADNGIEKFEREAFLQEVDGIFMRLAEEEPRRFVVLDAGRGIEDIADDAFKAIVDFLSHDRLSG